MQKWLNKILVSGLYLPLYLPLFYYRNFMVPFVAPKVLLFESLIQILLGVWLALMLFDKSIRPRLNWISGAMFVFLLTIFISSFFGLDFSRSLWSTQDRGLGLVAVTHFAIYALMLYSVRDRIHWRQYWGANLIASFFICIGALVQLSRPDLFLEPGVYRPGSTFGNPSFLASYLAFQIFIALWFALRFFEERKKALWIGSLTLSLFQMAILFITQTRGAILGFGAGIFVFLFYFYLRPKATPLHLRKETVRKGAGILLLLSILLPLGVWMTRTAPIWQHIPGINRFTSTTEGVWSVGPRVIALRTAWSAFKERPILGFGFENYKYPFDKKFDPTLLRYGFTETYFDKPHNVIVEYMVTGGIVGAITYLALLGILLWRLLHVKSKDFIPFGLAILVAYFVQNLFLFDTFGSYLMLFALLAFVMREDELEAGESSNTKAEGSKPIPYAQLAVALLIFMGLALAYMYGYRTLYANNRQYWGLNYLLNQRGDLAVESFIRSVDTPNPYRDAARKDFGATVGQIIPQGVAVADVGIVIDRAMSELAKAINNHPNEYYYRIVFAESAAALAPYTQKYLPLAEEQITQALISSPRRQQTLYAAARVKVAKGEFDEAMKIMQSAVNLDPKAPDPHFYYALTAFQAGNINLGFDEIATAMEMGRGPKTPDEARILANYYGDAGRYEEAIELYLQAILGNPNDVESKLKLGLVYYYMNDDDNARLVLEEVSKQADLTQSPFYSELKQIYASLGLAL